MAFMKRTLFYASSQRTTEKQAMATATAYHQHKERNYLGLNIEEEEESSFVFDWRDDQQ